MGLKGGGHTGYISGAGAGGQRTGPGLGPPSISPRASLGPREGGPAQELPQSQFSCCVTLIPCPSPLPNGFTRGLGEGLDTQDGH